MKTYEDENGLMWQAKGPRTKMTWGEAKEYCANLRLKGFSDWRLPTIEELLSIVDFNRYDPAIDIEHFPCTISSYYWTSSICAGSINDAWLVSFYYGHGSGSNKSGSYYVRAVRTEQKA